MPAPRHSHVVSVQIRIPSEGTWFAALAASVSADGLFVSTFHELLPSGSVVSVEVALPSGNVLVDGIATFDEVDGPGIRIPFEDLDERTLELFDVIAPSSGMRLTRVA